MPLSLARLLGIRARIERANEHIQNLKSRLDSFRETNPYGVRSEDDSESGYRIYRVVVRNAIPSSIPILIGEILYQLRSSLDHLVWQLVEASGNAPIEKVTGFPIFDCASKFERGYPGKVQGMCSEAISKIRRLNPYKGGNDALWTLHELNNIDKHRFLLIVGCRAGIPIFEWNTDYSSGSCPIGMPGQNPGEFMVLEDGAVFARVRIGEESEMDVNFQLPFEIAFNEPTIVRGKPVLPLLFEFVNVVEDIVGQFAPSP